MFRYKFRDHLYRFIGCWSVLTVVACGGVRQLPQTVQYNSEVGHRDAQSPDFYTMPHGKLHKNAQGLWELYVSGDPLERGLTNGILTKELLYEQETAFVSQLHELVPSRFRQWALRR